MAFPSTLLAGGIYVPMKGATATGLANVGLTSSARDGTTLFYNPAGMTRLGGTFVEIGVDAINADIAIDNRGSRVRTHGTSGQDSPYAGSRGHGLRRALWAATLQVQC